MKLAQKLAKELISRSKKVENTKAPKFWFGGKVKTPKCMMR